MESRQIKCLELIHECTFANQASAREANIVPAESKPQKQIEERWSMKVVRMGRSAQPSNRCVISLGAGRRGFTESLKRLEESLRRVRFEGDFLGWNDELPAGSPSQFEAPMAFKTFCFHEAKQRGYEEILWIDSPIVALRSLEPIFKMIRENGYVTFTNNYGQSLGQWSSDDVLALHQITRDEAMLIPETPTSVIGFNFRDQRACHFLDRWHEMATDGLTCRGTIAPIQSVEDHYAIAWNKEGRVSKDPRVGGHRFDQTAAGIIAHQLGMPPYAETLRDIHFKGTSVDRHTILLHHREFGEEITPLDQIYYRVFIEQPFLERPKQKLRQTLRRVKSALTNT